MTLVDEVYPNVTAPKDVARSMSKKFCFTGPFERKHGKCVETLLYSE